MAAQHPCIQCNKNITGRSHAITCDGCGRWNHRKCGTGLSHDQYLDIRRGNISIDWRCAPCCAEMEVEPADRSRHNSTTMDDIPAPPPMDVDVSPMRSFNVGGRDNEEAVIPDVTFDLTGRIFEQPAAPIEEDLPEPPLTDDIPDETPVTYEIVESGSTKGAPKLVSSDGFTYVRGRSGSTVMAAGHVTGKMAASITYGTDIVYIKDKVNV